jgi:hypothetical protein
VRSAGSTFTALFFPTKRFFLTSSCYYCVILHVSFNFINSCRASILIIIYIKGKLFLSDFDI